MKQECSIKAIWPLGIATVPPQQPSKPKALTIPKQYTCEPLATVKATFRKILWGLQLIKSEKETNYVHDD